MNLEIINHPNCIEVNYNDLMNTPGVIYKSRIIPKVNISYLAIDKNGTYIEVVLYGEDPFQINPGMVSIPACNDAQELYDILKTFLY